MNTMRFYATRDEAEIGFLESWCTDNEGTDIALDPHGVVMYAMLYGNVVAVAQLTRNNRLYMYFDKEGTVNRTYRCFSHFESWCMMSGIDPTIIVNPDSPLMKYCERVMEKVETAFRFKIKEESHV